MYSTQIVYRFEYPRGRGIYHRDDRRSVADLFTMDLSRHPVPDCDSKLAPMLSGMPDSEFKTYYFGFCSIEQLRNWFYSDELLKKLHAKGVVIAEYECRVADVLEGHTQAMFVRANSFGKEQYDILHYFKLEGE